MSTFKPMLASPADMSLVRWPMYASAKLDGVRAIVKDGKLLSRSLKLIPNRYITGVLAHPDLEGLDGELIVGDCTSPSCYRDTVSVVMSENKVPSHWAFYAFDTHHHPQPYEWRLQRLLDSRDRLGPRHVVVLPQIMTRDEDHLNELEADMTSQGHEGVILRDPRSPYKHGRSTAKEGYLLKVKRFVDGEARVLAVIEEMFNGNEATTNELGRTKRSSHQENKTGKGRMGALLVEDLQTKVQFQIGTGFDDEDKAWFWASNPQGLILKYKHFPIGVKDKPRHPVYLGLRDARDMS